MTKYRNVLGRASWAGRRTFQQPLIYAKLKMKSLGKKKNDSVFLEIKNKYESFAQQ